MPTRLARNRELNKPDDEAAALEGLDEYHPSAGQTATGTTHLRQAQEIYHRLGMTRDAARIHDLLATLPDPDTW